VVNLRYERGAHLSPIDNWAERNQGPFTDEAREHILQHPRAHIPDWVVEAAIETVKYVIDKYGAAPAYINPVRAKFSCQVHHVDLDYYRRYHTGGAEPYLATPQLLAHFRGLATRAHPDLYERGVSMLTTSYWLHIIYGFLHDISIALLGEQWQWSSCGAAQAAFPPAQAQVLGQKTADRFLWLVWGSLGLIV